MQRVEGHELGYLHRFNQVLGLNGVIRSHKVGIAARCRVKISVESHSALELLEHLKNRIDLRLHLSVRWRIKAEISIQVMSIRVQFVITVHYTIRVEHWNEDEHVGFEKVPHLPIGCRIMATLIFFIGRTHAVNFFMTVYAEVEN